MNNQRIEAIDSLRGIACLIVLMAHIISTNQNIGIYMNGCGKIGVWCFLILSGFLTFLPYVLGKKEKIEQPIQFVCKYYKNKILKLYPAYVVVLVMAILFGFLPDVLGLFKHILCIEGMGHFWYMPVIIKFYILVPILILLYQYFGNKIFVLGLSLIAVILSAVFPYTEYIENSISLYWYLPVFFMGCLLAFIYVKLKDKKSKIWKLLLLVVATTIVLLTPLMRNVIWGIEPSSWLQNKYIVFGLLWSVIVLAAMMDEKIGSSLAKCKILCFFGKMSYEIYLIHYLIMWKVIQYTTNTLWVAIIVIIMSILLAMVIHRVFEMILNFQYKK